MKKTAIVLALIMTLTLPAACKPQDRNLSALVDIPETAPLAQPEIVQSPVADQTGVDTTTADLSEAATDTLANTAETTTPALEPEPTLQPTPDPTPEPTSEPKTFAQLAPTTTMPFGELVGDNGIYEDIQRYPAPDTYRVIVDIYHQVVLAYSRDENGEYTVPERYMVCTTGGPKDPTPGGVFQSGSHRPRFGKFYNDNVYGQYWTQIVGKIYFHSLLYTQRSAGTYTTSSYKLLGKRGSHGCIRLLVPDARWIYYHMSPGSTVEIRAGSSDDAETAAIKEQLVRAPLPDSRPQVFGLPNTDVWSVEELTAQLESANSYALADGTTIRPYGDEYDSNGRIKKFGKLEADGVDVE